MSNPPLIWTAKDVGSQAALRAACWQRVVDFTGNPQLVQFATNLIHNCNIDARDINKLARCVLEYAQKNIKYFREQPERFASPIRTILWGIGDCDDKSIFIATVLRSFRIPVRLVFITFKVIKDGVERVVGHVWPQAFLDNKWVSLESVRPLAFGASPLARLAKKGIKPLTVNFVGDTANAA